MKKIYLAIICLSVTVLCSCDNRADVTFESKADEIFDDIFIFDFRGHRYIRFSEGYGQYRNSGIVHSPDCDCLKSKEL